eukprot:g28410.t1
MGKRPFKYPEVPCPNCSMKLDVASRTCKVCGHDWLAEHIAGPVALEPDPGREAQLKAWLQELEEQNSGYLGNL